MSDAPTSLVHLAVADGVATITLDSPHNRNALSRQLVTELMGHLETAATDDATRVIVIESSGSVFCSGADLSEASVVPMAEGVAAIVALQRAIVAAPKPVVTVLAGAVRAGGIGIIAASDIAICADESSFALTEVKLGLAAAVISLTVTPRMTSRAASWTFLSGAKFSGTEAVSMGLATVAVPRDELAATVSSMVAELATGAAQGLRESKGLLSRDLLERIDTLGPEVAALSARLFESDEAREAMMAFLSK